MNKDAFGNDLYVGDVVAKIEGGSLIKAVVRGYGSGDYVRVSDLYDGGILGETRNKKYNGLVKLNETYNSGSCFKEFGDWKPWGPDSYSQG